MEALIVVDVQNDFCPGGALAVSDGDAVVAPINQLARRMSFVVATRDWHPPDHSSFAAQGGPWPVHCVAETEGAQLHDGLDRAEIDVVLDKGQADDTEGYSGFDRTDLERLLREHRVRTVHVAGLALDYCVKATALDAKRAGFEVLLPAGASRAVNVDPQDGERALAALREAGIRIVD